MHFPCHDMGGNADFNCLFCYCPLYALGEKCGGIFTWVEHEDIKLKICTDCYLPHQPEYYDTVINNLNEDNISSLWK